MPSYAGLDVSEAKTHVCVLDELGQIRRSTAVSTDPETLADWLKQHAPGLQAAVLETGARAPWLTHGLRARGITTVCTCARQAHGALQHSPHKSDAQDAEGLARLALAGWTKSVHVRSMAAFERKALITARDRLTKQRARLIVTIRGLIKPFGLAIGRSHGQKFAHQVREHTAGLPELHSAVDALLSAIEGLGEPIAKLEQHLLNTAKNDPICRRLMSIPGVGYLTAQAFIATVDNPERFRRNQDVGAYLGLTPRHWQSGELDQQGHITRCGDSLTRHLLYECANNLISIVKTPNPLKHWAEQLEARVGSKKARTALARKLAVLMLALWKTDQPFDTNRQTA